MSSSPDARLRAEMVAGLRERGALADLRVAEVLGRVPRHVFVPGAGLPEAYADQAIVTRQRDGWPTSSASQPAIVAAMLEQLSPPGGGSVLEIGAGTGYNAALLAALVGASGRVSTIDIDPEVAAEARSHLAEAGATNVEVICGDGALGWAARAPYDGIIVTAGASDIAPAWASQLAPGGRLVMPLSIRGVQQCVALTHVDRIQAGGRLRSVDVRGGQFMPLTGTMANGDRRVPVPGHPGVYIQAAAETAVPADLVGSLLGRPGPATDTGVTAPSPEVFASLRPWLAFHEPASATLSYTGPADAAGASAVPAVIDFTVRGVSRRASPCLPGPAGLAVLDVRGPAVTSGDPSGERALRLAIRGYGEARPQTARLQELITAWDAAGRPGTSRLRLDVYPAGVPHPDGGGLVDAPRPGAGRLVHAAPHATFVVSWV